MTAKFLISKTILLLNSVCAIVVFAATCYSTIIEGSTGVDVTISIQNAEFIASAPSEAVRNTIEGEPAVVVFARILAVWTKICILAKVLTIHPDGMILVTVLRISRDAIVECGKGSL